jgi:hypothetical protein
MRSGGPIGSAHVFVDGGAQTHAGVEAVGHDVAKAVVHVELQLDVRIGPQQGRQLRQQHGVKDVVAAGDSDSPSRLVPQLGQRVEFRLDLVEAVTDGLH